MLWNPEPFKPPNLGGLGISDEPKNLSEPQVVVDDLECLILGLVSEALGTKSRVFNVGDTFML